MNPTTQNISLKPTRFKRLCLCRLHYVESDNSLVLEVDSFLSNPRFGPLFYSAVKAMNTERITAVLQFSTMTSNVREFKI